MDDPPSGSRLVNPENAAALDKEAQDAWGLSPFALVEAAGRSCAAALKKILLAHSIYSDYLAGPILVCAGSGNNGADALVMLYELLRSKQAAGTNKNFNAVALLSRFPSSGENTPRSAAVKALGDIGVPVITWNGK